MKLERLYIGSNSVQKAFLGSVEVFSESKNKNIYNIEPYLVGRYLSEVDYSTDSGYSVSMVSMYVDGSNPGGTPIHATLYFDSATTTVTLYTDSEKQNIFQTINVNGTECNIFNLLPNTHYWWETNTGERGDFATIGNLRMCDLPGSISNLRDLGGKKTTDNKTTRYGLIYRGAEMNGENGYHISSEGIQIARNVLGIGAELDFRTDAELDGDASTRSGNTPSGPILIERSALDGDDVYQDETLTNDIAYTRQMISSYANIQDTPTQMLNSIVFVINNLNNGKSVYSHCWAGADRTGTFCWLILGLLRVRQDEMDKDFELTSFSEIGRRARTSLAPLVTYLNDFAGSTLHEKIESYWKSIGVTDAEIEEFRTIMLE